MVYLEYETYKNKYHNSQKDLDKIIDEKEELFRMTQPQATDYSKERISGGVPANTFDEYLIKDQKKEIDKRLKEALEIVNCRKLLLCGKTEELEQSKDWYDVIYRYRYIKKLSIRKIEKIIPFSRSDIDRKIDIIERNINLGQKGTKTIV